MWYLQQLCIIWAVAGDQEDLPWVPETAADTWIVPLVVADCMAWGAIHLKVDNDGSS